ncbi:hypothetical protein GHN92_05240 [Pseudomonas sp. FSL R10-2964]|uniref:hypothetical protein n=1 Tax=Pseudomonas sp. FSL R10-2964 TaxID=2662202 RepID=UPI001296FB9B|nr:hypothetical protein [Pseudomonas sp. FSL R10-2964]MQT83973.1 hypothetical protein [Pseudomonas sp. FSL R10-2964]
MTKVIEIVVIGGTGSGKSHVLELIDKALRTEYGHHVQIASHDLSLERGLGNPGEKPRVSETIFNLRERCTASVGDKSSGSLKVEVDTSAIDSALEKIEALGKDYWRSRIASGSVEELQGFTTGYAIDHLESAIESTARVMRDERDRAVGLLLTTLTGGTLKRFGDHLDKLLALQLKQLSEPVRIECPQVGDVSFTELTSSRQ